MNKRNKRNSFAREWGNQTDIGRHFGMSAIALGKFLVTQELRDPTTKAATDRALSDGYAKATPLKDGTPFFMWNRAKIGALLKQSGKDQISSCEYHTKRVFDEMRSYLRPTDNDKLDRIAWDLLDYTFADLLKDVPKSIREDVRADVIRTLEEARVIEVGSIT